MAWAIETNLGEKKGKVEGLYPVVSSDQFGAVTSDQYLANLASQEEHDMSRLEAIKAAPWAFVWCLFGAWCIVLASFQGMAGSTVFGIPQFRKDFGHEYNGEFILDGGWQSAIDGAPRAAVSIGTLAAAWLADIIGRRYMLLIGFGVCYVGVTLEVIATSIEVFFAGKMLVGFGIGCSSSISLCYVGEIAPLAIRGLMTAICAFGFALGPFAVAVTMNFTSTGTTRWAYRAVFCAQYGFLAVGTILCLLMPESPWWLIGRDDHVAAEKSLRKLGVSTQDMPKRLASMRFTLAQVREETTGVTYLECFRLTNLRRTIISISPVSFQAFTGITFINIYFAYYVQLAGYSPSESFRLQIVQQGLCMFGNVVSWFLIDLVGRRSLTLWGLVGVLISHCTTGALATRSDVGAIKGVIAMQLIFAWFYNVTIGATAFTILAEVSTSRLRAKSVAIGIFLQNILFTIIAFVAPFLFNPDKANLGAKTTFIFAGLVLGAVVFVWFYLPETTGRTFEELDEMFMKRVPARKFKSYKTDAEARNQPV
ncbi:related to maltose permease [Cephalotrichum gorgonifer]|uniref:Related to maltose permease n=1 Tax=Cephalotrichum gorgonifer TaxID=2041049 RepID=A0AAE8N0C3_9PEZI|nr:related to maltose permease [Cephalotrichum gorgonifer]